MNLEIESYVGELRQLRQENQLLNIFMDQYKKSKSKYFICGEYGAKNNYGLPKNILICHTLGSDEVTTYEIKHQQDLDD